MNKNKYKHTHTKSHPKIQAECNVSENKGLEDAVCFFFPSLFSFCSNIGMFFCYFGEDQMVEA